MSFDSLNTDELEDNKDISTEVVLRLIIALSEKCNSLDELKETLLDILQKIKE